jgi:hypothetical protein
MRGLKPSPPSRWSFSAACKAHAILQSSIGPTKVVPCYKARIAKIGSIAKGRRVAGRQKDRRKKNPDIPEAESE